MLASLSFINPRQINPLKNPLIQKPSGKLRNGPEESETTAQVPSDEGARAAQAQEGSAMTIVGTCSTGIMLLILGTVTPGFAHQQEFVPGHPGQHAGPERRGNGPGRGQGEPRQGPDRPGRPQGPGRQGGPQGRWQDHRAHDFHSEHRDWHQRGGYAGYRIPEDRFRGHFGQDHGFRLSGYPMVMRGGYPFFRMGGFGFSVIDPWPEYWGAGWESNDDVYVDFADGGYYLHNRRYPGDSVALSVNF